MAQINMTPELSSALIERLSSEYGHTSASNFALDIMVDSANCQIVALTDRCAALEARCKTAEANCEELRTQLDPKRKARAEQRKQHDDRLARRRGRLGDAAES